MLNSKKIRLMTKLVVYENKDGKADIHLSKYYKTDYVRYQTLKSIISATVGYLLILLLIGLYEMEFIIRNAVNLDYRTIGAYILGIYIMVITIYGLGSILIFSLKYDASRKKLAKYYKLLRRLNKIYTDETPEN